MQNDLVARAMSFIFEADTKLVRENQISLIASHVFSSNCKDIMHVGVRYGDCTFAHPDRPKQTRLMPKLEIIPVLHEFVQDAENLLSDMRLLEKDTKRSMKTLTQLVRGMNTDQDLRDSFPDCLALKLGLSHLSRTREPAFRYKDMEPRIYANILKDLDMIEGYFNARYI